MSADEVYSCLRYQHIGMTTVYMPLSLLVKIGVARKFDFGEGKARYELRRKEEHFHFICEVCGKIFDCGSNLDRDRVIKEVKERFSKRYNFRIDNSQLYFYGVCTRC